MLISWLLHSITAPTQMLILVASGLFLAQRGLRGGIKAWGVFVVAIIVGCSVEYYFFLEEVKLLLLGGAAAVGILVAVNPLVSVLWYSVIAAWTGFLIGVDSTQEIFLLYENWIDLSASGVGACMFVLCLMVGVSYFCGKSWQKIGVRVVGSWVAASSLMVMTLSFSAMG